MIKHDIHELIGNTPLVRLDRLAKGRYSLFAKMEYLQPGGSIKDRAALRIIQDAYASGRLSKGKLVVEMTSGNMGSGLALVCRHFGNPFVAVMPRGNSKERIRILEALGAEVILSEQVDGEPGRVTGKDIQLASSLAQKLAAENDGFYVDQFNNPSGLKAHFETTGPEIWADLPGIDAFIASVGTGGTFTGTSLFLKSRSDKIKCIAVEPENAAILKTGVVINPRHIIQGTGYSLIPPHWNRELADDIITVSDDEVMEMTRRISHEQGFYVGYSSGANVAASVKYGERHREVRNLVTLLCDTGYKYSDL